MARQREHGREVFLASAARTPIGAFRGALADVGAVALGARAIEGALTRAGLGGEDVDETWMGCVLTSGLGQAPARQAARAAGIADRAPATTVGKVCGSGLQAVLLGAKSIFVGDAEQVVAGGMESMSQAPFLVPGARKGLRMGHGQLLDSMVHDGLWDPYGGFHMGVAGELCASTYALTRDAQDAWARESYERARAAQAGGLTAQEIEAVVVGSRRGETRVTEDEEPERVELDKLESLAPVFQDDGTITPGNASKINDGAAALVLASGEAVRARGLSPLARVVSWGSCAQAPEWYATAPVQAARQALDRAGLTSDDVDLWEINEAFAVVSMICTQQLELDRSRVNVRGGAVALGHPIGASGARIVVTLLHAMQERRARRGMAAICIGGGEALALLVEAA